MDIFIFSLKERKKKALGAFPFPSSTGLMSPCCESISVASEVLKYKFKEMASAFTVSADMEWAPATSQVELPAERTISRDFERKMRWVVTVVDCGPDMGAALGPARDSAAVERTAYNLSRK